MKRKPYQTPPFTTGILRFVVGDGGLQNVLEQKLTVKGYLGINIIRAAMARNCWWPHKDRTQITIFSKTTNFKSYGIVMTSAIVTDQFLQKVLQTSIETRDQCSELLNFVEATPVPPSKPLPLDIQLELSKRQKLLYSYLSILRGLNRDAILKVRGTKQTTAEARQEIDRLHLQLQNLYYEERHLRGEITACESYEFEPLHTNFQCRYTPLS